jgi:NADH dehydrogenase FAD-containing subunit
MLRGRFEKGLVGAGPTGVELAASLAQMVKVTLRGNFRRIDPATASIIVLDGAKRVCRLLLSRCRARWPSVSRSLASRS